MWNLAIDSLALVAISGLWGGMMFFAFVYAPLVFFCLMRARPGSLFVRFFRSTTWLCHQRCCRRRAALGSTHAQADIAALALVCVDLSLGRHSCRSSIAPAMRACLAARAGRHFKRLHGLSVLINAVQLVAVLVVLVRLSGDELMQVCASRCRVVLDEVCGTPSNDRHLRRERAPRAPQSITESFDNRIQGVAT